MANLADLESNLRPLPWTATLALKVARVDLSLPKPDQEAQIQAKIDAGELGPEAVRTLKRSGYDVKPAA